ncbi:MAG: hypothetical protein LBV67_09650 [Streptococcaceae bacterium]|nr:hypothetical protein [Streptococcaceae bacterium]
MGKKKSYIDGSGGMITPSYVPDNQEIKIVRVLDEGFKQEPLAQRTEEYVLRSDKRIDDNTRQVLYVIASVTSIQKMQLQRTFEEYNNLECSLKILLEQRLIQRWKYFNPKIKKDVDVFTLSGDGYYFLDTIQEKLEFDFYTIANPFKWHDWLPSMHVRFWMYVDVFNGYSKLQEYQNYHTHFGSFSIQEINEDTQEIVGVKKYTPVYTNGVVTLNLTSNKGITNSTNLFLYAILDNDSKSFKFPKKVLNRFENVFKDFGNKKITNSEYEGVRQLLTFVVPSKKTADAFLDELLIRKIEYTIAFIVLENIEEDSLENSLWIMLPSGDLQSFPLHLKEVASND